MKTFLHAEKRRRTEFITVVLISAMLLSCASKQVVSENSSSKNSSSKKSQQVELHLTSTQAYCGGAEPDQSMLIELATPKSYEGRSLYLRKGSWNDLNQPIVASGKSDATGNMIFQLEKGEYSVVFDDKKDNKIYNSILTNLENGDTYHGPVDKVCLADWIKKAEFVFTVTGSTEKVSYNVHIQCPWHNIPCAQYTGPLPP